MFITLPPPPSILLSVPDFKLDDFFGFCLAEIYCPEDVLTPLLPYRNKDGKIIYPRGLWTGVYFSEILKEIVKHGYKVKMLEGWEFSKSKIFNEYVEHFYRIKKTSSGAERFLAKMQLNQLYGYFGRNQNVVVTQNVNRSELNQLLISRYISSVIEISDDLFVVMMTGNLNLNIINQLPIDIKNKLEPYKNISKTVKSHVGIASAVTSYAQVEMMKFKTMPGYEADRKSVV